MININNVFLNKSKGFSITEVLLVVAILGILAGTSVEGYFYFKKNSELTLATQQIVNSIRKAKIKSEAMKEDDGWGVSVQNDKVIIFKGNNFSQRNQSFDEIKIISGMSTVSGINQVIFSKLTGLPELGSIGTLTLGNGTATKNIQINEEGLVSY